MNTRLRGNRDAAKALRLSRAVDPRLRENRDAAKAPQLSRAVDPRLRGNRDAVKAPQLSQPSLVGGTYGTCYKHRRNISVGVRSDCATIWINFSDHK